MPPTGFEPVISALRGQRPKPLDDEGTSGIFPRVILCHILGQRDSAPQSCRDRCAVSLERARKGSRALKPFPQGMCIDNLVEIPKNGLP